MMEKDPKREEELSEALLDLVTGGSEQEKQIRRAMDREITQAFERAADERARHISERLQDLGEQRKQDWTAMYQEVFRGWQGVKQDAVGKKGKNDEPFHR
jgi:hypothetical protein